MFFARKATLRWCAAALPVFLIATVPASSDSGPGTLTFEGYSDSTVLTTQYSGLTFTDAVILTAGISLNEFEFPATSGSNVIYDNNGPISLSFTSPIQSFTGHFTYSVPVTLQAFDASNNLVDSTASRFANNEALSGVAGSQPDEVIQVGASAGIARIVITGNAGGTSFTVDDILASPFSFCDFNQEGRTSVTDIQSVVNQVLGGAAANHDLNQDGTVNVVDVQIAINAGLGLGCSVK